MNITASAKSGFYNICISNKTIVVLLIATLGTLLSSVNFAFSTDECEYPDQFPFESSCDTYSPDNLVWDANNGKHVDPGESISLAVSGGFPPYKWEVDCGDQFYFGDHSSEITTSSPSAALVADASACGSCTVRVSDYCDNSTDGIVLSTSGEYKTKYYFNGDCGSWCSCQWGAMGDYNGLFGCSDKPCGRYSYEGDMRYYFLTACLLVRKRQDFAARYEYLRESTCSIAGAVLPGVSNEDCSTFEGYDNYHVVPWLKEWQAAIWVCNDTVVETGALPN
jgi:hypothetical protein